MLCRSGSRVHLLHCLQVAAEAQHENRRHILAQFYDEACRREWSKKAERGDVGFDIEVACLSVDQELLKRARNNYKEEIESKPKNSDNHQNGGTKGSGKDAHKGSKRSHGSNGQQWQSKRARW